MMISPTSFIGLGALGGTLARAFSALNIPIKSMFNRSDNAVLGWVENKGIATGTPLPGHKDQLGALVFITVSDDAIADVVDHLHSLSSGFTDTLFVHCSGNESADIFEPLQKKGAEIASMHPLQTFNKSSKAEAFRDI